MDGYGQTRRGARRPERQEPRTPLNTSNTLSTGHCVLRKTEQVPPRTLSVHDVQSSRLVKTKRQAQPNGRRRATGTQTCSVLTRGLSQLWEGET